MANRSTRRYVLSVAGSAAVVLAAGCSDLGGYTGGGDGGDTAPKSTTNTGENSDEATEENPVVGDAEQVGDLALSSPAFDDGQPIPRTYGRDDADVNPPLSVSGVPDGAETLVLVVDDPDAVEPAGEVWLHWLVWNVPATRTEIPEDWTPEQATEGVNDFGERGYGGPAPPDGEHKYRFKLYALDTSLDIPTDASKRDVGDAMRDHVLASTQLVGMYAP
ncbi:YbhB/YbcL family Raf kinase inhibitor-like protein [Halobacterium jilantaiense]|uniref:Phospholipid-binding protein, PBP family n=1 Tax=Halobacterium jilantaiense TaxID=355548 RepID=A0A1I0Q0C8_9EURY|nr:YbhB/YbcL family Raf kinase inhibitor-like protein [Halobacterium jilantaiense]SEW19945.1 phospholipid-binding protein, PBP family [Halobacterium jilantaiense]